MLHRMQTFTAPCAVFRNASPIGRRETGRYSAPSDFVGSALKLQGIVARASPGVHAFLDGKIISSREVSLSFARMNLLPFGKLPAYKPRTFVPQTIDLGDWLQIAPLFDQLEACAAKCKTVPALERWLLDWSELTAALDEESSRRYIAMTCHTDNPGAEKAYLHFVEHVEPRLKQRQFALEKIYIHRRDKLHESQTKKESRTHGGRPSEKRFFVFDRDVKNHVELFRPGKRSAGNRGSQTFPAIPEIERLAHRQIPW